MSTIRILLLEDSPLDDELARARLTKGGLDFVMRRVDTRDGFVAELESEVYDLILADYSLPSFDGLSALEIARRGWPHLPFIFVSGYAASRLPKEWRDRPTLQKPFQPRDLAQSMAKVFARPSPG